MHTERLTFAGSEGHVLSARLEYGETPWAYAIFAHCFTCSKNNKAATNISRALAGLGIGVLRFDFTGLGDSEGEFSQTTFTSNVDDLLSASDFMKNEYESPAMLIGHSLGGAAVLQAAAEQESVKAVVTIGAPYEPGHVRRLLGDYEEELAQRGAVDVSIGGRKLTVGKQFIDDIGEVEVKERLARLRCALLVMHSPIDNTVGIDNAAEIFQAARHPKSFVSLDTADHLLSKTADSDYVGRVIAAWVERYLD